MRKKANPLRYAAGMTIRLTDELYAELRQIAQAVFAHEAAGHTLSRTAVVHEAWLRLAAGAMPAGRTDFLRLAARVMRNLLVDHARQRNAAKRGGGVAAVAFDNTVHDYEQACADGLYPASGETTQLRRVGRELDLESLDRAIDALARQSPRQAEIVELKFFADVGIDDIARQLGTSPSTVKREWTVARLFLLRELAALRAGQDGAT